MLRTALCAAIFVSAATLRADDEVMIPVVGRPAAHFYEAAGTAVKIHFTVEPAKVTTADWFRLTLTISSLVNPQDVGVPDLRKLAEFNEQFEFKDFSARNKRIEGNRCIITYETRARTARVAEIPRLPFHYFNPKADPDNPALAFPLTLSDAVPLKVTEFEHPPPPVEPIELPPELATLATGEALLRPVNSLPSMPLLLVALAAGPAAFFAFLVVCRLFWPDAVRFARLQRNRAVRKVIRELDRINQTENVAERVAVLFAEYLRSQFQLPGFLATGDDFEAALRGRGLTASAVAEMRTIFADCDQARFAGSADVGIDRLPARVRAWIHNSGSP